MTGKKISQLDKLTELTGTEIIPVAKDGQNYGVETAALYEVIDREHAGTLVDPIPYIPPMEIFSGKYYKQNGVLYLCNRDSGQALTHNLEDLVGLYVEKEEE